MMEWISVDTKLPPENQVIEVICVRKTKQGKVYSVPLTWRLNDFYFFLDGYICLEDITHWMLLPTPPTIE